MLYEEMRRIGARPPLTSFGISMLGPALLASARPSRRPTHLPRIARGEIRWCQGYSEPGAGSDLASLRTKAEDKGDHFLVNGQKIWTSYADKADWIFCLVRTDRDAQEAAWHLFPADRHGDAGRLDQADRADLRQVAVLRDLLRQRRRAEGKSRRQAQPRLGRRQISADARARDDRRRRLEPVRHRTRSTRPPRKPRTAAGSPTRSCAPRSPRPPSTLTPPRRRGGAIPTEIAGGGELGARSAQLKYDGTELNKRRHELTMALAGADGLYFDGNRAARAGRRAKAGCARRAIRSRAARRKSCSTSSPSACSTCPRTEPMLTLNEDQTLLMDSARAAVAAVAPISEYRRCASRRARVFRASSGALRARWAGAACWSPRHSAAAAFGAVGAGLVAREMARTLAPSPFLSTAVLAAHALAEGGSAAQQAEWLPRIAAGEAIVALAVDEGRAVRRPRRRRRESRRRLAGSTASKHFVLDGHVADALPGRRRLRRRRRRCFWSTPTRPASRARPASSSTAGASRASRSTQVAASAKPRCCRRRWRSSARSTSAARRSPRRSAASPRRRSRARSTI